MSANNAFKMELDCLSLQMKLLIQFLKWDEIRPGK